MYATTVASSKPGWRRLPVLPVGIAIYAIGAVLLSPEAYSNMLLHYGGEVAPLSVLFLVGPPIAAIVLRPRAPISFVSEFSRYAGPRLVAVSAILCLALAAFTTYKLSIPQLVAYYADPALADFDAWLHFGNPGELAHAVLPKWAQYPLAYLYGQAWFLLWFGIIAVVALHRDSGLRQRYFWTMAIAFCLLGTVAATLFSSAGPVFYERIYHVNRYASLMAMIENSAAGDYMRLATSYLYANYLTGGHEAGTGISAMPSMHLAVATLNAHLLTRLNRACGVVGWVYVAVVLFGSVYLGWHYAIDGYLSIAAVTLLWWLSGRVPRSWRSAQSAS